MQIFFISAQNPNTTVMIRTCALDSGTLTADTEIVRMSHCGHFVFDKEYYQGCVQSCARDGCNAAVSWRGSFGATTVTVLMLALFAV